MAAGVFILVCEKAPRWGLRRKEKSERQASGARSSLEVRKQGSSSPSSIFVFAGSLPHLGAFSQTMFVLVFYLTLLFAILIIAIIKI